MKEKGLEYIWPRKKGKLDTILISLPTTSSEILHEIFSIAQRKLFRFGQGTRDHYPIFLGRGKEDKLGIVFFSLRSYTNKPERNTQEEKDAIIRLHSISLSIPNTRKGVIAI